MIISRTPFRISFAGGGSDLQSFYSKHGGAVLSTSINKYNYLSIHPYFAEDKYFLKYSHNELVEDIDAIQHPIIREVFKYFGIKGVDFSSSADIPSGTGLASSSAFTAGLINLCCAYKGIFMNKEDIAALACDIEINKLNEPIGKQDQYACSIGGMNFIEFHPNESVSIEKISLSASKSKELESNLMMFYLGKTRLANSILAAQKQNIEEGVKIDNLKKMVQLAFDLKKEFTNQNIEQLGDILHTGWMYKKELAKGISSTEIDEIYETAKNNGARGGKLLGAGGNGFLLFYVEKEKQDFLKKVLSSLVYTPIEFDTTGTSIIF